MAPFESPATLSIDTEFIWTSSKTEAECCCRLRIYKLNFDYAVTIVSEVLENPGRSITEEAETLIHLVCDRFRLTTNKLMWIEHYPAGYLKDDATYDEVMLTPGKLSCRRISQQKLEELLRVKLE
ncbi:MAG: hypothetical protein AAFQ80_02025 [Cyanobacteria bacterium J06621_8]